VERKLCLSPLPNTGGQDKKMKFFTTFCMVFFGVFTLFWGAMIFYNPEGFIFNMIMFISNIILTAIYLNQFVENINKNEIR
jgi:hypothetical protein